MPSTTQGSSRPRMVVVYDGECPFCRRQIEKMRRRDEDQTFDYLPRQTEGLVERFPKLAEGDFATGMRLAHPDGSVTIGADAVYQIARRLKGWKRLAWMYRVPVLHTLAKWAYRWVVKNRMKFGAPCDQECRIEPFQET